MFSRLLRFFQRYRNPEFDIFDNEDLSWMFEPEVILDASAWDKYWIAHLEHGIGPQLLDMWCHDHELVEVMNREKLKTVLCVGSGISQEPRALAEAGFNVVAMDISPIAMEIAGGLEFNADDFDFCCDPQSRRPGGTVDFVVGDFRSPALCPGPFDVIIERKTLQLYAARKMDADVTAVADRLDENGIFFSQCHDGCWRPPAEPIHYVKPWFKAHGWNTWYGEGPKPRGRVAWTFTTTG